MMRRKENELAPVESLDLASLAMPSERPPDFGMSPDPGGTVERMERGQAVAAKKYDEMRRALARLNQKGTGERAPALPPGRVRPAPRTSVPPLEAVADSLSLPSGRARPAPRTSVPSEGAAASVAPAQPGYVGMGDVKLADRALYSRAPAPGAGDVRMVDATIPVRDGGYLLPAPAPQPAASRAKRSTVAAPVLGARVAPEERLPEISNPFPDEAFAELPPDAPIRTTPGAAGDRAPAVAAAPRPKPAPAGERPMALPTFLLRAGDQFNVMGTGRKADHSLADSIDADVARRQALFDKNALDADARARNPEAVKALGDKATREEVMAFVNRELARKLEDRKVSADEMRARAAQLAAQPRPAAEGRDPIARERALLGLSDEELARLGKGPKAANGTALRRPTAPSEFQINKERQSRIEKLQKLEKPVREVAGVIDSLRELLPSDPAKLPSRAAFAIARGGGLTEGLAGGAANLTGLITNEEQDKARKIAQYVDQLITEEGLAKSGLTLTESEQARLRNLVGAGYWQNPARIYEALDILDEAVLRNAQAAKGTYSDEMGTWDEYNHRNPGAIDPDRRRPRARGAQATAQPAATAAPRPSAADTTNAGPTAAPRAEAPPQTRSADPASVRTEAPPRPSGDVVLMREGLRLEWVPRETAKQAFEEGNGSVTFMRREDEMAVLGG